MADPKFPGLEALAKMQKDMENGVLPGLRRDPETRRDDTQPENTRRAQREGKREEKKAERQEQKDDRAQRTQERLEAAKQKAAEQRQQREAQRGLGLKLPPPPDPAVMEALVAAKPNLKEGASLLPPVQPLEGSKRGEPYTPTPIPQNWQERAGGGNKIPLVESTRRWDVYANETNLFMRCGRIRIAGDEGDVTGVTISGATSSLTSLSSVADGDCVWLECASKALAGLTLEYGTYPSTTYEESGGNITRYSHAIGDVFSTDPGAGSTPIDAGNSTYYYRARVPDCDLTAKEVTVFVSGNATHGVIIEP